MADSARVVGRYEVLEEIAAGGMATIHLGRVLGTSEAGPKFIAVKRMHGQYARDPDFRSMFMDEARLCARIQHENVVPTIDVVEAGGELLLILELVEGESLSRLSKLVGTRKERVPIPISAAVIVGLLNGLHAAHEAVNEAGEPLQMVHRDVSPHNVFVGTDGVTRVLDFGVAKARGRMQQTQHGQVKGKIAYMSPEQARGKAVDRRSDVFAAGIVLWELLTGRRLFDRDNEAAVLAQLLTEVPALPSERDPALAPYDSIVKRALSVEPGERFSSALEMAKAVEAGLPMASRADVATWVQGEAREALAKRSALIAKHVKLASRSEFDDTPRTDIDEPSTDDGPKRRPLPPRRSPPRPAASAEPELPPEAFLTQRMPLHPISDREALPAFRPPPPSSAPLGPPPGALDTGSGRANLVSPSNERASVVPDRQATSALNEVSQQLASWSGRPNDGANAQSQVSSVSLSMTEPPPAPPLSPERVRQLAWVGGLTALGVAAAFGALFVIVAKHQHGHVPAEHQPVLATMSFARVASSVRASSAAAASAAPTAAPIVPEPTPTPSSTASAVTPSAVPAPSSASSQSGGGWSAPKTAGSSKPTSPAPKTSAAYVPWPAPSSSSKPQKPPNH